MSQCWSEMEEGLDCWEEEVKQESVGGQTSSNGSSLPTSRVLGMFLPTCVRLVGLLGRYSGEEHRIRLCLAPYLVWLAEVAVA